MENYRIVGTIGKGGMGRVYRATRVVSSHHHHHDHQHHLDGDESPPPVSSIATVYYALKKVPVTTLKQLNQALKEAQAVSQLHHYRIIKCHEFFIDRNVHHLQSTSSSSSLASTHNFHHHHHQSTSTILEVPPPPTPTPPPTTTTTTTTTWSLLKLTKLGLSHHHNNNNNNNNSSLTSPSSLISSNHKNSNKRNSHGNSNNNSSSNNSILENLNLHLPNRSSSSSSSSSNNQNHRKTSLRRHKSETGMSRSLDSQTNHSQLMNHILNHNNNNDDFEYHHNHHHQLNDFDHHQNYDNEYMNGSNMSGNMSSECPLPMNETWSLCLVLEYCSHGTLKNMIERQKLLNQNMNNNNNNNNSQNNQNKKQVMMITEELFWRWMQQICEGLAFMHNSGDGQDDHFYYHQEYENSYHGGGTGSENQLKKKKIIHRDVKPENIFLSDEWLNIKIGDLGMARILDLNHSTHASSMAGTMCFMAPEMKTIFSPNSVKSSTAAAERPMKRSYDEKIDIWGVGCVACELTSLIRCDYSYVMSHPKEQQKMVDAIRCMKFSDRVIDWILVTLQHDPRDRPTASQLLQDFFHVSPMRRTLSSSPPPLLGTHLSPSSSSSLSQLLLSPTLSSPTSPSSILLNVNGGVGGVGAIGGGGMVSFADPRSRNRSESDGGDCDDYRRRTLVSRRIPDEIYILIFSYFTEVEVAICSQVCTRWFNLFNSNKGILWKILFENVWKMDLTQAIQDSIERDFGSLREGFTVRSKLERNWHVGKYKYASFLLHGGSSINGIHFFMGHRISQHYLKHIYRHHKQRRKNLIDKGNRSVSKAKPFVDHFKYDDDYGMHSLTITAGEDGTMKAFDIYGIGLSDDRPLKKELICTFSGHQKGVSCLDFNLQFDKRVLVSGSADKCIIFWDVLSGEPINRITCASEIWDLQILNGTTMGSAGQSCVDLWDLTSNTKLKSYNNCHQGAVYAITHDKRAFHEQCFATGGFDGAVRIWDMRIDSSNGAVMSYIDMQSSINEVQFFGNNLVTGNGGGIVDVFDIRFLDQSKKQYSLNLSSSGAIRGLQFDGLKIVSGSSSGAIKLMDAQSGKFINHMMHNALQEFKSSQMTSIDCNQNVLMTSSMGGQVSVFDFTNFVDTTTEDDMTDSIVSRPSDRSCSLQ